MMNDDEKKKITSRRFHYPYIEGGGGSGYQNPLQYHESIIQFIEFEPAGKF